MIFFFAIVPKSLGSDKQLCSKLVGSSGFGEVITLPHRQDVSTMLRNS